MRINTMRAYFFTALLMSAPLSGFGAELTVEQQTAKTQGIVLYNQFKATSAIPHLTMAAEAGDAEAQYYLAEALRKNKRYTTADAQGWYEAAAEQGDFYAMIRLGRGGDDICIIMQNCPAAKKPPAQWLKNALNLAKPGAEKGNSEAMYLMYELTLDRDWLEKSANAGNATAQYWMAIGDRQGEGFLLPWKRNNSVGHWFKASAEGGNPRAMMEYAAYLHENDGDLEVARHWIEAAAKLGYKSGVSSYGAYLAHAPALFDFKLDLVKGYAITSLLKELDGGGNIKAYVEELLPEIAENMTPEQIKAAEKFAIEWKASHPPLSFFPDKLGQ
ncbi:sel1 repeat family protein [Pseudomonas sp. TH31]|nr:sel1 repeat family protein [Pseudomonas sp. TH31]